MKDKAQPAGAQPEEKKTYTRFSLSQRIEHAVLLISFSLLGLTGLPQKYATTPLGEFGLRFFGGIETTRIIHRSASIVLMVVSIYHILAVLYRVVVKMVPLTMLPVPEDFKHLWQDIKFYLGQRDRKAFYGRYNYVEKAEYLAVVWGTLIMAITGFMMWNPIATAKLLPGEFIPAAKAAHGGEAVLAVLAIILWHFYHVHIRHFNTSIFTGELTQEEMAHEHPAELAAIESGEAYQPPPPELIRKRQRAFIPVAALLTLGLSIGLVAFVSFEETAIETIPDPEPAPVFVPLTPTPEPTLPATPTSAPIEGEPTWSDTFEGLFRDRCGSCHGVTQVGGLSLATYELAIEGGVTGPSIVPGDSQASVLIQVQQEGGHPGQLSEEELQRVIEWIEAGAPEG